MQRHMVNISQSWDMNLALTHVLLVLGYKKFITVESQNNIICLSRLEYFPRQWRVRLEIQHVLICPIFIFLPFFGDGFIH